MVAHSLAPVLFKLATYAWPPPPPPATLTLERISSAILSGGIFSLVRTCLYFAAFLGCLLHVLMQHPWRSLVAASCVPYSLGALIITWRLILIFFVDHVERFGGLRDPPNLFVDAYVLVCDEAAGWWWSSVLLLWVTVATPMLHAEATRRGMSTLLVLSYVSVAFLGAVSLAFPMFMAHLLTLPVLAPDRKPAATANGHNALNRCLWPACVGASLVSIALLPWSVHASRATFIVSLVALHTVLVLPVARAAVLERVGVSSSGSLRPEQSFLDARGYTYLAALCACMHVAFSARAIAQLWREGIDDKRWRGIGSALVAAAARNVCQESITVDAVLSSLASAAFIVVGAGREHRATAVTCVLLGLVAGPAAGLALDCARREQVYAAWGHQTGLSDGTSASTRARPGPGSKHLRQRRTASSPSRVAPKPAVPVSIPALTSLVDGRARGPTARKSRSVQHRGR